MDVAITRMSSKGQVVIPAEMRTDILEGEKLLLIQNDQQIIMKKASDMDKNVAEDIEFAKKTDEAWKKIEEGKGIKMDWWFHGKDEKVVEVIFDPLFERDFKKIKDRVLKEKVIKQISKIRDNPENGKPMSGRTA